MTKPLDGVRVITGNVTLSEAKGLTPREQRLIPESQMLRCAQHHKDKKQ